MKTAFLGLACAAVLASALHGAEIDLVNEDFESGFGPFTAEVFPVEILPNNDTPLLFTSADPLLYTNTGNPGSQSAGFSSDLATYDMTRAVWLQKQFPAAVAPGTYLVHLEMDLYVYKDQATNQDPFGVGNRVFFLTDEDYNVPGFDFDQGNSAPGFRRSNWPGSPNFNNNGVWQHVVYDVSVTTATGNIELRLLMHDKYGGKQAVAWDNLSLQVDTFSFSENFEAGLGAWTTVIFPQDVPGPSNDTPSLFASNDALLYTNTDNPGSQSAGYSSANAVIDRTRAAWLQVQLPAAVAPGTHTFRLEADMYVYKDPASVSDPFAVANRMYVLTDEDYDLPEFDYNKGDDVPPGFTTDRWSGWDGTMATQAYNGVWLHRSIERDVTTASGNLELRLLIHEKYHGAQAVAWDNVRLVLITPCNLPRMDFDGDGDVDQEDFSTFQLCVTGVGGGIAEGCACADLDNDMLDVDEADFEIFRNCSTGPEVELDLQNPPPNCTP